MALASGCGGGASAGAGGNQIDAGFSLSPEREARLAKGAEDWRRAKAGCQSYEYRRSRTSIAGRSSHTTYVRIAHDQPIERSYEATQWLPDGGLVTTESWRETGSGTIGQHDAGAPPSTVEELFAECRSYLARDPKENYTWLEWDGEILFRDCGYRPNGCADDCGTNIYLGTSFTCLSDSLDAL